MSAGGGSPAAIDGRGLEAVPGLAWAQVAERWRSLAPSARRGLYIVGAMIVLSYVIPFLSPYSPVLGADNPPLRPPSLQFLFGTDQLGRDVFVRAFAATQTDLALAAAGVAVPLVVGTLIGALIGSTRIGFVQYAGDVAIEGINAFPTLIVIIALIAAFGPGPTSILVALWITAWARYAKVARARARVIRDIDFVEVGRGLGYSWLRILLFHITPNVFPVTIAYAISHFVEVVLAIAAMSFLGAGVQPPTAEWGVMMSDGRIYMTIAPWLVVFPGILLTITAIGVALLGTDQTSQAFTEAAK